MWIFLELQGLFDDLVDIYIFIISVYQCFFTLSILLYKVDRGLRHEKKKIVCKI